MNDQVEATPRPAMKNPARLGSASGPADAPAASSVAESLRPRMYCDECERSVSLREWCACPHYVCLAEWKPDAEADGKSTTDF